MTPKEALDLQIAICATFPRAVVKIDAHPDGADILVSVAGEHDRKFKIDDDYSNSPIVRLLVGAPLTK